MNIIEVAFILYYIILYYIILYYIILYYIILYYRDICQNHGGIKLWNSRIIILHRDWKLICGAGGVTTRQQPRGCQLQPSLISQEDIANNGVNSHLWCRKSQLIPTDILSPLSCPDLLTRTWQPPQRGLMKPRAGLCSSQSRRGSNRGEGFAL